MNAQGIWYGVAIDKLGMASGTVFISYSSKNRSVAIATREYLCGLGVKCWMAPGSIPPGEQWAEAIARVIPESSLMVLLWTSESMSSRQVINELTLADRSGVMIIPFRLEEIEPEGAFKYYLYKTHWLDAIGNAWKDKLEILGERVLHNLPESYLQSEQSPETAAATSRARSQQTRRFTVVGLGFVLLLSLLAVGLYFARKETPAPAQISLDKKARDGGSVDQAVNAVRSLYLRLTDRQFTQAMELVSPDIQWQFKSDFFRQFDRVTVQDLKESGITGSTVNLNGIVTFVWPDGSIQRERRSFSIDTSTTPSRVTSTEFGGIVQSR